MATEKTTVVDYEARTSLRITNSKKQVERTPSGTLGDKELIEMPRSQPLGWGRKGRESLLQMDPRYPLHSVPAYSQYKGEAAPAPALQHSMPCQQILFCTVGMKNFGGKKVLQTLEIQ